MKDLHDEGDSWFPNWEELCVTEEQYEGGSCDNCTFKDCQRCIYCGGGK